LRLDRARAKLTRARARVTIYARAALGSNDKCPEAEAKEHEGISARHGSDPTTPVHKRANYALSAVSGAPCTFLPCVDRLAAALLSAAARRTNATRPASATALEAVVGKGDVGPAGVGKVGTRFWGESGVEISHGIKLPAAIAAREFFARSSAHALTASTTTRPYPT